MSRKLTIAALAGAMLVLSGCGPASPSGGGGPSMGIIGDVLGSIATKGGMARKVIEASGLNQRIEAHGASILADMRARGEDPALIGQIEAALPRIYRSVMAQAISMYSSEMTRGELRAATRFLDSPAGQAMIAAQPAIAKQIAGELPQIEAAARARFADASRSNTPTVPEAVARTTAGPGVDPARFATAMELMRLQRLEEVIRMAETNDSRANDMPHETLQIYVKAMTPAWTTRVTRLAELHAGALSAEHLAAAVAAYTAPPMDVFVNKDMQLAPYMLMLVDDEVRLIREKVKQAR